MKKEFSKLIVIFGFIIELLLSIFTCFMVYRTMDLSGLVYISATSGTTIISAVAFYFWKAKAENKSKMAKVFAKEIADKYGIESAIAIMDLVMKE